MEPLLPCVDAVTIPVPDLDTAMAVHRDALGHELVWRNEAVGQAALRPACSQTEIVLTTRETFQ